MTLSNEEVMYRFDKYFLSLKDLKVAPKKDKKGVAPISPNKGAEDSDSAEESLSIEFQDLLKIDADLVANTNDVIEATAKQTRKKMIREVANDLYSALGRYVETEVDEYVVDVFFSKIEKFCKTFSSMEQDIREQKMEKADVHRSGSTWDYETFYRYAEDLLERDCQFEFKINWFPAQQNVDKIMKNIRERFQECGRVLSGDTTSASRSSIPKDILEPLKKYMMREESVRAFLNIMLFPVFDAAGVKVLLEQKLNIKGMPTNICDYILVNGFGERIGVIEAKDRGKINEKSVIQCLLQMLSLQKVEGSGTNLFGIVTDAYHFIFLSLRDKTITFYCKENFECDIWKNHGWKDMEIIINTILSFCR